MTRWALVHRARCGLTLRREVMNGLMDFLVATSALDRVLRVARGGIAAGWNTEVIS